MAIGVTGWRRGRLAVGAGRAAGWWPRRPASARHDNATAGAPDRAAPWRAMLPVLVANVALALGGLVRDLLLATFFGLSPAADALTLAWFLADACGNAVLASAAAAAAVPYLLRPRAAAAGQADTLLQERLGGLLVATAAVAAVAAAGLCLEARPLVRLLEPDSAPQTVALTVRALRWLAPYVVALPLSSALGGALVVRRRFATAALMPLVTTAFIVSGPALFGPGEHVIALAGWLSLGAAVTLCWPARALARLGVALRPRWPAAEGWRALWGLCAPIGGWLLLTGLGQGVDRYFAGALGPGALAGISYVAKFGQAPIWIFAAAVTMVVYPALAETRRDPVAQRTQIGRALLLILAGSVPLALAVAIGARPVITLVLAHGRLSAAGAASVGAAVAAFAPGIPAGAAATLLYRALFASDAPLRALGPAAATLVAGALADAVLAPRLGLVGLGLSGAVAQWCGALGCLIAVYGPRAVRSPTAPAHDAGLARAG